MSLYVFDTSSLSVLIKHFYESRFPSLWIKIDDLINSGKMISVREARRELEAFVDEINFLVLSFYRLAFNRNSRFNSYHRQRGVWGSRSLVFCIFHSYLCQALWAKYNHHTLYISDF